MRYEGAFSSAFGFLGQKLIIGLFCIRSHHMFLPCRDCLMRYLTGAFVQQTNPLIHFSHATVGPNINVGILEFGYTVLLKHLCTLCTENSFP